ncbi:MAG TPA: PAS domain S-box protein [Pyrinomonadaceae bacterium]|jgi:PAS domain S-box-containing protein
MPEKITENFAENEAILQGTIDALKGHIAILDRDGNIVKVNRAWLDLVGDNSADGQKFGIGSNYIETCRELIGNPIGGQLAEGIAAVASGERSVFEIEYPYDSQNERRWYVTRAVTFGTGETLRIVLTHENITSRKYVEQALRESEENYRILAQTASDVILKIDRESKILFVNGASERVFGYKPSELLGQPLTLVIPEQMHEWNRKDEARRIERAKAGFPLQSLEITAKHKDGRVFPLEISLEEFSQSGRNYFIGIARDITGRKRAERATAYLASIVKSSDDAVISKDLNGVITSWNKGAEKVFGYTAEEAIGKPITILIPLHHLDEEPHILERIRRGEQIEHYETERLRKDGTHINISLTVSPIQDEAGKIIGASKIARDITERIQTTETLRENQMMLSLAMQASRMGAWERDIATGTVIWNEELEEIFGLEKGSFDQTIEAYNSFIHVDDRRSVAKEVERAIIEQRQYSIEFRFYHADGSVRWMEGRGQAVYSDKGEPVRLYGIGIDITERKKAEEKLRESEQQLQTLANSVPQLVWMAAPDGSRFWFNQRWFDYTGTTFDEVKGFGWQSVHHPEYLESVNKNLRHSIETGELFEMEYPLRGAGGNFRWFLTRMVPVRDTGGNIVRWFGSNTDIDDSRGAQERLIEAERRAAEDYQVLLSRIVTLAQTLGTARDLLTIYRTVGEFIRASMPCTAFFVSFYEEKRKLRIAAYVSGEEGEVDISTLPPMLLSEDGGPNSQAIFQKKSIIANRYMDYMKTRPHVIVQENGIDPNSSLVVPMTVMNRILGTFEVQAYEENAFVHEHVVALEMVANLAAVAIENVRLLEVEAKARQEAEAANRAKDEFLSVLSHELRTPLNAMLGWTRMMKSGVLDEARKRQAIETIERNARLQNNLIEDLLDVSRIISGKMRIETEDVDIVSIVKTCVETAKPATEEKNISLTFKSDSPSQKLGGDATRLQQIVNNLLSNAVKFTPADGNISVALERADDVVRIKVSDTGIGISPEFLPSIFDRFQQADSTTRRSHSGLGLGLTIVRHLTELHGGKVEVSSRGENQGSVFTIDLPIVVSNADVAFSANPAARNETALKLKGAKILLVDDDCEGIQPLQIFLETQEAEVYCAHSAREALKKISENRFDVLVSDIGMPEMDGYELIAEARKLTGQNYFLPAIALTAYASSQDRERALSAGYQTHLPKPLDFEQFLSIINNLLCNHE